MYFVVRNSEPFNWPILVPLTRYTREDAMLTLEMGNSTYNG